MKPSLPLHTLLCLALLVTPALSAEPGMWKCDGKFGLCRYVDRETGREIIPPRFERGMAFREGLAAISIGGQFGYVDERGDIVIEPRFDRGGAFANGLAEVVVGDKAGIINRKGEFVVSPMFLRAIPLTADVIIAVEGKLESPYDPASDWPADTEIELPDAGLYHIAGHWVSKPDLARARIFNRQPNKEGLGLIWARDHDSQLYGLLASNGEWVVRPTYAYAGPLSDGVAVVRTQEDGKALSGAIDGTGKIVVPLGSQALFSWRNGWGLAQENYQGGKQALLDRDGKMIGERFFDKVDRPERGDIARVLTDGRWAGIDRAGNIVADPDNGKVIASCPNGVRLISRDGKVQIADNAGVPTSAHLFEPLAEKPACDGPFAVKLASLSSFVGVDGRLLFDPPAFTEHTEFEGGYAAVSDGKKWGIIDTSGRFTTPMTLDRYLDRRGGLFRMVAAERDVWLTPTGEERPKPPVTYPPAPEILDCGHGLRLVEREGLWGITDAEGKEVIPPRHRALGCFRNGISWAAIDAKRQWCALGPDGAMREKPACRTDHYLSVQPRAYPERFDKDPFENSVLWSRAYLEFGAGQRESPPQWVAGRPRY